MGIAIVEMLSEDRFFVSEYVNIFSQQFDLPEYFLLQDCVVIPICTMHRN